MAFYPNELADQVFSRLSEGFFRQGFIAKDQLQQIINECFFASLKQEEGDDLSFNVCIMSKTKSLAVRNNHDFVAFAFANERPFNGSEIAKLAPAIDEEQSCICVWINDDGQAVIWGIVSFGRAWSNWHKFGETPQVSGPTRLTISVKARGHLIFLAGFIKLLEYLRGDIVNQGVGILQGNGIFKRSLAKIFRTPIHPELRFETILAWMLDRMTEGGHGGALIAVDENAIDTLSKHCEIKYKMQPSRGPGRVVRSNLSELMHHMPPEQRSDPDSLMSAVESECRDRESDYLHIREYADALASMAQIDGALILTNGFKPVGFSARIMNWSTPSDLVHTQDFEGSKFKPFDLKKLGTRHGSAAYLASICPGLCIFVVSQDGHVSAMLKSGGKTLVWTPVDPTLGLAF